MLASFTSGQVGSHPKPNRKPPIDSIYYGYALARPVVHRGGRLVAAEADRDIGQCPPPQPSLVRKRWWFGTIAVGARRASDGSAQPMA